MGLVTQVLHRRPQSAKYRNQYAASPQQQAGDIATPSSYGVQVRLTLVAIGNKIIYISLYY